MNAPAPTNEEMARLEEAAEWVQVLSRHRHDDKVVESWLEWCSRDPLNQQAFEGLSKVWGASAQLTHATHALPRVTDLQPQKRSQARPQWIVALAASVMIIACGALLFWRPDQSHSIVSPAGVRSTSELPDGSVLDLGGHSRVTLQYSAARREVNMLDGELFVQVSKDKARPFIVTAGPVRVVAVGTAFNVRRDADRVIVTVSEGVVEVARDAKAPKQRLSANQQLVYLSDTKTFEPPAEVDASITTSWRTGVLKFVDEPLSSVVASVNRYSARTIAIRDSELEKLSFTGTVHPDRVDRWLSALENAFPLTVEQSGEKTVTLVARP
jgi:transmembrane sensor